jgi:hypothetical protein
MRFAIGRPVSPVGRAGSSFFDCSLPPGIAWPRPSPGNDVSPVCPGALSLRPGAIRRLPQKWHKKTLDIRTGFPYNSRCGSLSALRCADALCIARHVNNLVIYWTSRTTRFLRVRRAACNRGSTRSRGRYCSGRKNRDNCSSIIPACDRPLGDVPGMPERLGPDDSAATIAPRS